jgi:hypothetical protein
LIVATAREELDAQPLKPRRSRPWVTLLVLVLVLAPVIAACISVIGRHWHAGGDQALEMLRIEDVGTSHTPLLGAWSRWGWAHPGPALFWALAPFYRAFGETGVPIGMGVLNVLAIAGVIVVAHRRGGYELAALAGLMVALLIRSFGLALLVDIWNPWAAFLPFVLFVMLAWAVFCRDWAMLPLAVLVGSVVAQIHAGYLPLVIPLLAFAIAFAVAGGVREHASRWLIVAGAIAVVVWLPALSQQLFGSNGNLRALLSYVRHPTESTAGWTFAYGTFGAELRPAAAWVTGSDIGSGLTAVARVWPAALTLTVVIGTGLLAWRRRQHDAALLCTVTLLTVVFAVIATSRLTGPAYVYLTRWWWVAAALANLAVVWAVIKMVNNRVLRLCVTGVALAGTAITGIMSATDLPVSFAHSDMIEAVAALNRPTSSALDRRSRYLIERFDASQSNFVSMGLFLALENQGYRVFTPSDAVSDLQYGNWRVATLDDVDAVISVVDVAEPGWHLDPRSRLVASYDPLSPSERDRATHLDTQIRAEMGVHAPHTRLFVLSVYDKVLAEFGGASPADVEELAALQGRGDGFAVYLSPAP